MKYKMAISQWIKYLYFGLIIYMIGMSTFLGMENEIVATLFMIPVIIMLVSFFTHSYYVLYEDHIFMRNSFFFKRIKYEDIIELERIKRSTKQTFALNSERIMIKVRNKKPVFSVNDISPQKIEEVYDELKRRCRNLGKGELM